MNRARMRATRCLLAWWLSVFASFAATVELTVTERDGPPLRDVAVLIHPPPAPGDRFWGMFDRRWPSRVTGPDGKVAFEGLPTGSYTASVSSIGDLLINPSDNPYAPAPVFTIAKDDERVKLQVELWRGVPLTAQLLVDHDDVPLSSLVFRSMDGLHEKRIPLLFGRWQGLLVPGRWEAQFEFPAGYLLADLVWNRESLPGHIVRMDVTDDPRSQLLGAYLNARSLITGTAVSNDGSCPGRVVATLVEPAGDWIAGALSRGGSEFRRVTEQFRKDCVYRLWLPEGLWIVRPEGDSIVGSDPGEAAVAIGLGEERQLDFSLQTKHEGRGQPLVVKVVSPERRPVTGAVVEVYESDAPSAGGTPVATKKTEAFLAGATFDGLSKGTYRVVAGHADFLDAEEVVREHDPTGREPTRVTVALRDGARIHGHAADEKGISVREVELRVERLGEPPKTRLVSEAIRASKVSRLVLTDATGHAEVKGLPSGEYRISGKMSGELSGTRFVRVRRGSEKETDRLDATLSEEQKLDVDLVVQKAGSLTGSLACSDGGTLPPEASFRIFDFAARPDWWKDAELREGSLLASDSVRLTGKSLDRFRVGPLEPGSFALAVRPRGNEYWSWPPDLLVREHAASLDLEEPAALDVGLLRIECGPVVMLVPRIASGEPPPSLRHGTLEVTATVENAAGKRTPVPHETDSYDDRSFIRGLPEAKVEVGVHFSHPYLIPSEIRLAGTDLDLLRGRLEKLDLRFQAVGGLLQVRGGGAAARRISRSGDEVVRPAAEGEVSFPGSPVGIYRVELCADAECRTVERTWDDVPVLAGRTVSLP